MRELAGSQPGARAVRPAPSALIAEDEPLVAAALERALHAAWPELTVASIADNGIEAIERIRALRPDVVFLDIAMPGASGLDVARACAELAEAPQIVFVTAYDHYALDAFERAAIDYLLKPVEPGRLEQTVARLKVRLAGRIDRQLDGGSALPLPPEALQRLIDTLQQLAPASPSSSTRLTYLRASVGNEVRIVPVEDVMLLEAADKYVVVTTSAGELLIRTSLKELLSQLDPQQFWQVHRGTIVNVRHVESASTNAVGKTTLKLRGLAARVAVSRQYSHLFRQM